MKNLDFALIGASRVGISLAHYLFQQDCKPVWVWNRSNEGLTRALRWVPFKKKSSGKFPPITDVNLIIIGVKDDAIAQITEALSRQFDDFRGKYVVHLSGVYSADLLKPLHKKQARIASIHPCQTIPSVDKGIHLISQSAFVCDGYDHLELFKILKQKLKKVFLIDPDKKAYYHLAAVFASNYLVILLDTVKDIVRDIGLEASWAEIFTPLIQQSTKNILYNEIDRILTGPIMRGDLETIKRHLQLLEKYPYSKGIYSLLGLGAVEVALASKSITQKTGEKIIRLLQG